LSIRQKTVEDDVAVEGQASFLDLECMMISRWMGPWCNLTRLTPHAISAMALAIMVEVLSWWS
jgi:hypothetical protein